MEEYLRLLRIFNERHKEKYYGYVCVSFFDDGSGYLNYDGKEIMFDYELDYDYHFNNFEEYKNICENY